MPFRGFFSFFLDFPLKFLKDKLEERLRHEGKNIIT